MFRLLLVFLGGWLAFSTALGLFLGRVMAMNHRVEVPTGSAPQEGSRHAA